MLKLELVLEKIIHFGFKIIFRFYLFFIGLNVIGLLRLIKNVMILYWIIIFSTRCFK